MLLQVLSEASIDRQEMADGIDTQRDQNRCGKLRRKVGGRDRDVTLEAMRSPDNEAMAVIWTVDRAVDWKRVSEKWVSWVGNRSRQS